MENIIYSMKNIKNYKELLYNYNDLVKIFIGKEIELTINQNKKIDSYIDENQMDELLAKIIEIIASLPYINNLNDSNIYNFIKSTNNIDLYTKLNKYKNIEDFLYYNNFEFVDEETIKLIDTNNEKNKDNNKNVFDFILAEKRIIIKINTNLINIEYLHKNIFNIELIIKIKEEVTTNIIIDKIKSLNFNGFKSVLLFNEYNLSDINDSKFIIYNLSKEKQKDSLLKIKESLKSDYEDEEFYLFVSELNESKQTEEINANSNVQQIQKLKKLL